MDTAELSTITLMPQWILDQCEHRNVQVISPVNLAGELIHINRPTILFIVECFDMLETDDKGQLKKMKKRSNPFVDDPEGLLKIAKSQFTVNFNYETKRANRGGDEPETRGSWHAAYLYKGKITPLAVHKGDCYVNDSSLPLAQQSVEVDQDGTTIILAEIPRLYLRYEIMRDGGNDPRQERKMRRESRYTTKTGEDVAKETVESHLKSRNERKDETDFQLTALQNVAALTIAGQTFMVRRR